VIPVGKQSTCTKSKLSKSEEMEGYRKTIFVHVTIKQSEKKKKTPGLQSSSELYRPSDRRLSAKLVPTSADRGCRVVSATNPHGG
jgi:hypothetical protein